ncbi:MAG: ABC transporter permease subunit [Bacteroidota bacterium]
MRSKFTFVLVLLFVYVVLFEFILPLNKVLPKPTLVLYSFGYIWTDYNFLEAVTITSTSVYLSLLLAYFVVNLTAGFIIKYAVEYPEAVEKLKVFRYFPAFFFAILFSYWFHNSIFAEFLFAFLSSLVLIVIQLIAALKNYNKVYVEVAKNLGVENQQIYSKVIFKNLQPNLFTELVRIHYYLWILVMVYEFINSINGFGGVYRTALQYNDFAGLFSIAILISVLILFGSLIIKIFHEKIIFWEE